MGLIRLIEHVAETLTGSTVSTVAADEVKAWSPWLAARLTKFAVKQLPKSDRERYAEEWDSHVADTPGSVGKICVAFGFLFAAHKIRRENTVPAEIQNAHLLFCILGTLSLKVNPIIKRFSGRYAGRSSTPWYVTTLTILWGRITGLQLMWAAHLLRKERRRSI